MDYLSLLATIGGGVAGEAGSAEDKAAARRILEQLQAKYGAMGTPQLNAVDAQELGPSALEGIQEDPALREAEMGGLDSLKQMQDMGGLTLGDTAALNKVQNQLSRRESAGRASIANDFAARGQLGSGAQLAMSLANQQDSANRANETGMDTAANAQKRYFDSVLQRGKLAGEIGSRDYDRQSAAARARDSIAAHNAAARTDAARYRNDVANQNFSNQMGLTSAQAGAGYHQANYLQNQAAQTAAKWNQVGQGVAEAASSRRKRSSSDDKEED